MLDQFRQDLTRVTQDAPYTTLTARVKHRTIVAIRFDHDRHAVVVMAG